jgi:hypothetical protein
MKTFVLLLLACLSAAADAQTTRLSGTVRDNSGKRISDLTLHFYKRNGAAFDHLTVVTAANGTWSIDLPPGEWRGAANSDDILRRGYFCFPGFIWCGDAGELCGGDPFPPLWGDGEIIWNPVGDPGLINVTVIPTRPDLGAEKPRTAAAGVKVSFETTTEPMTTVRQWRIEKSTDLAHWTPMQTVALSGSSPVIVPDPGSATAPVCYYRAVQVADVVVVTP